MEWKNVNVMKSWDEKCKNECEGLLKMWQDSPIQNALLHVCCPHVHKSGRTVSQNWRAWQPGWAMFQLAMIKQKFGKAVMNMFVFYFTKTTEDCDGREVILV